MSTHPLDLHPLRDVASSAWNEIRKESQPLYEDLPIEFKSRLLDTATRVESGDPNVAFECRVQEKLAAKKAAEAKVSGAEDTEPVEMITAAENAQLELKGHLPSDFPAYDKLHEAGINTYGQLSKVEDLTSIEGVGPATVKVIKKRLKADAKTLNA